MLGPPKEDGAEPGAASPGRARHLEDVPQGGAATEVHDVNDFIVVSSAQAMSSMSASSETALSLPLARRSSGHMSPSQLSRQTVGRPDALEEAQLLQALEVTRLTADKQQQPQQQPQPLGEPEEATLTHRKSEHTEESTRGSGLTHRKS